MSSLERSTAAASAGGRVGARERKAATLVLDLTALGAAGAFSLLPWRSTRYLGNALGRVAATLGGRKRARIEENLGHASPVPRASIHRVVWSHVARTYLEILWLSSRTADAARPHVRVEGLDALRQAGRNGRGVLLVSGHVGNWELVSLQAARAGLPVAVVARPMRTRRLERRIIALRRRGGVRTLLRDRPGSSVAAYRWLAAGGVLGCMMDRAGGGKRVLAPFLGKGTHVPLGPARLACRTDAAVVLGASRRREDGTIAIRFRQLRTEEVHQPSELARVVAAAIEAEVRTVPEQWLWIYRGQPDWSGDPVAPAGPRARAAEREEQSGRITA